MRNGNKKTILILCLVVVLVVGLFVFVSQKTQKTDSTGKKIDSAARSTADDFVKAMQQNKPDSAYALFTKEEQASIGDRGAWTTEFSAIYGGKTVDYKFESQETLKDPGGLYKGKDAQTVTYTVTVDGQAYTFYVFVIHESNKWLITDYDSTPKGESS